MNSIDEKFETVEKILENLPKSWIDLTTHRLDIYDEERAKSQFLEQLLARQLSGDYSAKSLEELPTAYDYIRLGHQLSSILEWILAEINGVSSDNVITFISKTMPILAILRNNCLTGKATYLYYNIDTQPLVDVPRLEEIYGYKFESYKITDAADIPEHSDGTVIFVTQSDYKSPLMNKSNIDVTVNIHPHFGSAMVIHNSQLTPQISNELVNDVQHVRRRETIAMTPVNALNVLHEIVGEYQNLSDTRKTEQYKTDNKNKVYDCIQENTGSVITPLIASSGLSIQYAILMGLVEDAMKQYPDKSIEIILPPNCYGGTNDQARRIADLIPNVGIVDLLVDGGQDMVSSLDLALKDVALSNSVPIVLAEIPTNPRVEVPDMDKLAEVLKAERKNSVDGLAVAPVFMVDQTFCPNVKLLHQESELAEVKTISFSSGSKFPSGGRCIAGYCAANNAAKETMVLISKHLILSDNEAVSHQLSTLAENMPSMPERIIKAYSNARIFVRHIQNLLPESNINFVSAELAEQGFTPSVFSLDLPSTGQTKEQREENKRILNKKLIDHMITAFPGDCKYCVSYGQLKGSYWTIPATSTQGTTQENDKDYIVRVALSPDSDVAKLSKSFTEFCRKENLI